MFEIIFIYNKKQNMGKKQSKVQAAPAPQQAQAQPLPADYVLVLKSDTCPACIALNSLIKQYRGTRPILYQSVDQALQHPVWAPIVQRAYVAAARGRPVESVFRSIPLLMRVRRGQLVSVRLGNFADLEALKTFVN